MMPSQADLEMSRLDCPEVCGFAIYLIIFYDLGT